MTVCHLRILSNRNREVILKKEASMNTEVTTMREETVKNLKDLGFVPTKDNHLWSLPSHLKCYGIEPIDFSACGTSQRNILITALSQVSKSFQELKDQWDDMGKEKNYYT